MSSFLKKFIKFECIDALLFWGSTFIALMISIFIVEYVSDQHIAMRLVGLVIIATYAMAIFISLRIKH